MKKKLKTKKRECCYCNKTKNTTDSEERYSCEACEKKLSLIWKSLMAMVSSNGIENIPATDFNDEPLIVMNRYKFDQYMHVSQLKEFGYVRKPFWMVWR